jgi:hypothetical protein
VVSVAATGQDGSVASYSGGNRTPISVAAPGVLVASDWPGGGFSPQNNGTSFAAAFVSGEAALIRSAARGMTAAQVVNRIESTADGTTGAHSGAGIINPVQAVTAVLPSQTTPASAAGQPVSIPALPHANSFARTVAVSVAAGGFAAALLVVVIAVVLPRGRRRGWRPGRIDPASFAGSTSDGPASFAGNTLDGEAIGEAAAEPGSGWDDPEAPRRRGIHARGASAGAEVATRPAAHAKPR